MTLAVLIAVLDVGGLLLAPSEVAAVRERLRTDPAAGAAWETVRLSAEKKFGESTEVPDRGGQMRTLVLNSQPTTTNPQHNTENE